MKSAWIKSIAALSCFFLWVGTCSVSASSYEEIIYYHNDALGVDTISYLEGFYSPADTRPSQRGLSRWVWACPMQNHSLCFESFKDEMSCTVQFTCRIQPSRNDFRLAAPRSGAGPTLLPFPSPSSSRWAAHAGVSLRLKSGRRHETRGAVDVSRAWI